MYIEPLSETFRQNNSYTVNDNIVFLPSIIDIVKHLARISAENDYKHFLTTGEIPYTGSTDMGGQYD